MKNVIFFVVLAILTVAALVGWNAVRNQNQVAQVETQLEAEPTPTSIIGTAVGRGSLGSLNTAESTQSGEFATKGNTDGTAGVIPTSTPVATTSGLTRIATNPIATVTVSPVQTANQVLYTEAGFSPKTLTVKSGTMVKFINRTNKKMAIVSREIAGGKKLDNFSMDLSVGKDSSYEFQFNQVGSWGYLDQNNVNQTALVIVN